MRPDQKSESKLEARNLFSSNQKMIKNKDIQNIKPIIEVNNIKEKKNSLILPNNNSTIYLNINDENFTKINNLEEKNENTLIYALEENITEKEEKIKKIQKKYRSYHLRNKYKNEIKPSLSIKTANYINKLYFQCSKLGKINENPEFSIDNYQKFYPKDEPFFVFDKGKVFQKQIKLKNLDSPENLEIYEGETNNKNQKHGFGTLTTPLFQMKGTWRNDDFTGWGEKIYRNGDSYEGKFIKGDLSGKGIFRNKDGNIYIGDFAHNERCGKGELTTNKYHYIGDFRNDKFNGKGKIEFIEEESVYEGQFLDNEIEGKGTYKWKNDEVYEGQMKKGKMEGYGKYYYNDGNIYEGEYNNGIKNGRGKLIYPDGKIYEGTFVNGLPDGEGFYTKDGHTFKVLYTKGKFDKIIA